MRLVIVADMCHDAYAIVILIIIVFCHSAMHTCCLSDAQAHQLICTI